MKRFACRVLLASSMCLLAGGCGRRDEAVTASQPIVTLEASADADSSASECPPARGEGTIAPAVSIYAITFDVNGFEQALRPGEALEALPGDAVSVRDITICAQSFSGDGGEVCVDFAPVDQEGQEMMAHHAGTHMVRMAPGFTAISGPDHTWTVGEDWRSIAAVLNHWPPQDTQDLNCGSRRCEHDDRIIIAIR